MIELGREDARMFIVDPTMYAVEQAPAEVYGDLDRLVRPDLRYHYATPICAQRWLDVCADPGYGHVALMEQAEQVLPDVARALQAALPRDTLVDFVSLGTGNGEFDARILAALADRMTLHSYVGLDFSFELLRHAILRVSNAVDANGAIPVFARCGDFTAESALSSRDDRAGVPTLFSLTGFTLGNYSERDLLASVATTMGPADHLFIDARLHSLGTGSIAPSSPPSSMVASYDLPSVRRFVFGPVELATYARADEVQIGFEMHRRLTSVPGAVNLQIVCYSLETTMRLTGAAVRRQRLDLAVTTRYDLDELTRWIEGQGLAITWRGANGESAFYLLRRAA